MEGQITKLREDNEILLKDFAKNIGKSLREIKKKTEHDYYLNAQEAVDFGIADKIIRRLSEIQ
jgi:ATP-dependent Clp protease protease subunit